MEIEVLLAHLVGVAGQAGRPIFPLETRQALYVVRARRLLVTTPEHLRALSDACEAETAMALPPLAAIVSATAPMPPELAVAAEARFGCALREFFGSTETCVIAQRSSSRAEAWRPFPRVQVQPQPDGCLVHAPQRPEPGTLAALVDVRDAGTSVLGSR